MYGHISVQTIENVSWKYNFKFLIDFMLSSISPLNWWVEGVNEILTINNYKCTTTNFGQ